MDSKRIVLMGAVAVALAGAVIVAVPYERFHNCDPDDFKPLRDRKRRDYPTISELSGRRRFIKSSKR